MKIEIKIKVGGEGCDGVIFTPKNMPIDGCGFCGYRTVLKKCTGVKDTGEALLRGGMDPHHQSLCGIEEVLARRVNQ